MHWKCARATSARGARTIISTVLVFAAALCAPVPAIAFFGPAYINIPGIDGRSGVKGFEQWVRVEAQLWGPDSPGRTIVPVPDQAMRLVFTNPQAPRSGAGQLLLSIDRRGPAAATVARLCDSGVRLPSLTFAERSERQRAVYDRGGTPPDVPEYYRYRISDVTFHCPKTSNSPEIALVLSFRDIEWLNYRHQEISRPATVPASTFSPAADGPRTKTFLVTSFDVANDFDPNQCPITTKRPSEDDYYALVSPQDRTKEEAELKERGGVPVNLLVRRGPERINICMLPGVVSDPGISLPKFAFGEGLDLDGDDGTGKTPARVCRHSNLKSRDGRKGIDNQLGQLLGCIPHYGFKGAGQEVRRNFPPALLIQISDIDSLVDDKQVTVSLIYSQDEVMKNAAGDGMLPNYTYRVSKDPMYKYFFVTLNGRIENGVLTTDSVDRLPVNLGYASDVIFHQASLRLTFAPDGKLNGYLGGYNDWRDVMAYLSQHLLETAGKFQCPSVYNALKRMADGMKDPVSGECNGISVAYEIRAVPAFLPSDLQTAAQPSLSTQEVKGRI